MGEDVPFVMSNIVASASNLALPLPLWSTFDRSGSSTSPSASGGPCSTRGTFACSPEDCTVGILPVRAIASSHDISTIGMSHSTAFSAFAPCRLGHSKCVEWREKVGASVIPSARASRRTQHASDWSRPE